MAEKGPEDGWTMGASRCTASCANEASGTLWALPAVVSAPSQDVEGSGVGERPELTRWLTTQHQDLPGHGQRVVYDQPHRVENNVIDRRLANVDAMLCLHVLLLLLTLIATSCSHRTGTLYLAYIANCAAVS